LWRDPIPAQGIAPSAWSAETRGSRMLVVSWDVVVSSDRRVSLVSTAGLTLSFARAPRVVTDAAPSRPEAMSRSDWRSPRLQGVPPPGKNNQALSTMRAADLDAECHRALGKNCGDTTCAARVCVRTGFELTFGLSVGTLAYVGSPGIEKRDRFPQRRRASEYQGRHTLRHRRSQDLIQL